MVRRQVSFTQPAAYPPSRVQVLALEPWADPPIDDYHIAFRQTGPRRTAIHRSLAHVCTRGAHQPYGGPLAIQNGRLLIGLRCELISCGRAAGRIAFEPQLYRLLLECQCAACSCSVGRRPDRHLHRLIRPASCLSAQHKQAGKLRRILGAIPRPRIGKHACDGRAVYSQRQIAVESRLRLRECSVQARRCDDEKNCCPSYRPHDRKPKRSWSV